jgi:hypothetical protein
MTSVISFAPISDPYQSIQGQLLCIEGRFAELALDETSPLARGALVQFQTPETLYMGEIESSNDGKIRVLIEHSVNLERASYIRRLWHTESSD